MKTFDYNCPIEATLEVISGKWKMIILYYLLNGPKRFSELLTLLETVSTRILSKQLQELEKQDILQRRSYPAIPPKVEYSLTEYGKTLAPLIDIICMWGEERLLQTGKKAVYN
jgi:DNA-binding HxlR family transcriptional regulator